MDNSGFEDQDLPGASEITVHNGRIALGGVQAARSPPAVGQRQTSRPPRPHDVEMYFDSEGISSGQKRTDSVIYSHKGEAEVTYINIRLTKNEDVREGDGDLSCVGYSQDGIENKAFSVSLAACASGAGVVGVKTGRIEDSDARVQRTEDVYSSELNRQLSCEKRISRLSASEKYVRTPTMAYFDPSRNSAYSLLASVTKIEVQTFDKSYDRLQEQGQSAVLGRNTHRSGDGVRGLVEKTADVHTTDDARSKWRANIESVSTNREVTMTKYVATEENVVQQRLSTNFYKRSDESIVKVNELTRCGATWQESGPVRNQQAGSSGPRGQTLNGDEHALRHAVDNNQQSGRGGSGGHATDDNLDALRIESRGNMLDSNQQSDGSGLVGHSLNGNQLASESDSDLLGERHRAEKTESGIGRRLKTHDGNDIDHEVSAKKRHRIHLASREQGGIQPSHEGTDSGTYGRHRTPSEETMGRGGVDGAVSAASDSALGNQDDVKQDVKQSETSFIVQTGDETAVTKDDYIGREMGQNTSKKTNEKLISSNDAGEISETTHKHYTGNEDNEDIEFVLKGLRTEATTAKHNRFTHGTAEACSEQLMTDSVWLGRAPVDSEGRENITGVVGVLEVGDCGQLSAMDRVKSWVVSQDDVDEASGKNSPLTYDKHFIAEIPMKVVTEEGHPELAAATAVFSDEQHAYVPVGDMLTLSDGSDTPTEDVLGNEHVLVGIEDSVGHSKHALLADDATKQTSIHGIRSNHIISEDVAIEMINLDSRITDGRFPRSTIQHPDGNTFDRSFLEGWTPSSPYAHHLQRQPSALSEGSQPHVTGKTKIRQLSLAIGEEWEDMTGYTPVASPDVERAFSYRSHRRLHNSESDGHCFFGRNFRYMSHPPRLESYYRRSRLPEEAEAVPASVSPTPADLEEEEEVQEEKRPEPQEKADVEKTWLKPNPYNDVNQRFHSTLQCPCCLFFCFLCCVPAVYYMQMSDKEFDNGSKEKAKKYGKKATLLYVIGSICSIIFLTTTVSLVVIYLQEYLTRK